MFVDPRFILASPFRFTWRYLRWPSLHLGFNLEFCRSQHAFLSSNITIYIILAEPRLALAWLRLSFCFTSDVLARLPIRVCKICALMHHLRSVRVLERVSDFQNSRFDARFTKSRGDRLGPPWAASGFPFPKTENDIQGASRTISKNGPFVIVVVLNGSEHVIK